MIEEFPLQDTRPTAFLSSQSQAISLLTPAWPCHSGDAHMKLLHDFAIAKDEA